MQHEAAWWVGGENGLRPDRHAERDIGTRLGTMSQSGFTVRRAEAGASRECDVRAPHKESQAALFDLNESAASRLVGRM